MTRPIAFIEDKRPDFEKMAGLLADSASANRWTNFGPVWQRLKEHIESALDLPRHRCAVPSASGTHALYAAAALAARSGVERWVVSAFGFRATVVGPFANAAIVDCDSRGLIDLTAVDELKREQATGMIATNPFGIFGEMNQIIDFARQSRMPLILDNAAAFGGFERANHSGIYECMSFHHTKPFGFGEGGCLIVDRDLESDAMAAMDFGYRGAWPAGQAALSNGKLSDPAAALILSRQQASESWVPAYREQFWRIFEIGERAGLRPAIDRSDIGSGAYGSVPLICPGPVRLEELENGKLQLQKYYRPLGPGIASRDLYARIINVPCHPGVVALSDDEVVEILMAIRDRVSTN